MVSVIIPTLNAERHIHRLLDFFISKEIDIKKVLAALKQIAY